MPAATSPTGPPVVAQVTVTAVRRLSPTFVRIEFGGPDLGEFGLDGPIRDARIKLVIPPAGRPAIRLPSDGTWYEAWRAMPEDQRGALRTYSVRELTGSGAGTRLVVDFVLHLAPGSSGPASRWAAAARPGDRLVVVGPRRGAPYPGIEFDPGDAERVLLAADETAVPAAARILADLPVDARGVAFLEVPCLDDVQPLAAPPGMDVRWLVREGGPVGCHLLVAVPGYVGSLVPVGAVVGSSDPHSCAGAIDAATGDPGDADVWETPSYSGSGETLASSGAPAGLPGFYAWIAGESAMVRQLRRRLVTGYGLDRRQVAFMGYWRRGAVGG